MFGKNVVQWTSEIKHYSKKGLLHRALSLFLKMQKSGIQPNEYTFSTTLTVCSQSFNKSFGLTLHSLILKKGFPNQLFVSSGLISMYFDFGLVINARKVFDEMPKRDEVVCNLMIAKYSQNGFCNEACRLFCRMVNRRLHWKGFVSDFTLASVLNACGEVGLCRLGECVQGYGIKIGYDSNEFVGSSLIGMYSTTGELGSARVVFDQLGSIDVVVWNTMINGYAQSGFEEEAIELFLEMENRGVRVNHITCVVGINASCVMPNGTLGRILHGKSLKIGFMSDVFLGTAIVDMYSKFQMMTDAQKAFFEIPRKNVISYTALITGYGLCGDHNNALRIYTTLRRRGMVPDACTFIGLFTSSSMSLALNVGKQVHLECIKLGLDEDVSVRNSIVNFYSKCGCFDSAITALSTPQGTESDIVSWTAIISGLVHNNEASIAFNVFREMHKLSKRANEFSSSSIIKAVANLAAVASGRNLHGYVLKAGLNHHIYVGGALIDMYSKCGVVKDAHKLFSEMPKKNVIAWNSMITGYARNGFFNEAITMFREMLMCGFLPTSVTFVGVLLACFHGRLVEEGKHYYQLMENCYGISPSVEHYSCMVNLLGCCGYVSDAEKFLLNSPFREDLTIWKSLLTFCEAYKDFDVAARVTEYCLRLNPDDSSTYTILSNVYAAKNLWSEVERTRDVMKMTDVSKEPGCSWIYVK